VRDAGVAVRFYEISRDNARPLGVYLLCVAAYQLGLTAWTQIHGGESLFWSRSCLFVILEPLDLQIGVYYAIGFWLAALGIAMTMGRSPLKTYLVGEIILDLPSLYIIVGMLKNFTTLKLLAVPAVFLLESVIPVTWAAILLGRKWRLRRLQTPRANVPGIKSLGIYLLAVSLLESMVVLGAFVHLPILQSPLLPTEPNVIRLVCSQFIGPERMTREDLDIETPEEIEQAEKERASFWNRDFCLGSPLLLNFGFAIGMLAGCQALKTFAAIYWADALLYFMVAVGHSGSSDRKSLMVLHWCMSLFPAIWASLLMVRKRRLRGKVAGAGVPASIKPT
jgi:hypothetical protein